MDIPQTLGSLTFANSGNATGGYTLMDNTGTNTLTMSNSSNSSPAVINVTSGTHALAASMMISGGDLTVSASSYGQLTISGSIADDSPTSYIPRSLTLTSADGTGELILSGTNSYAGGTIVQSGTLVLADNGALAAGSSLTIGDASAFTGGGGATNAGAVSSGLNAPLADHEYMVPAPSITPVPEPATLVLLAAGATLLLFDRRWRRRK